MVGATAAPARRSPPDRRDRRHRRSTSRSTTSATRPSAARAATKPTPTSTSTTSTFRAAARGRVFVGQRKEPFYIARRQDLRPVQPQSARRRKSAATRTTWKTRTSARIAIEVPIACLTAGGEPGHRRLHHGQRAPGPPAEPDAGLRPRTTPARKAAPGRRCRASACRWSTRSSSAWTTRTRSTPRKPKDDAPVRQLRDQPGAAGADRDPVPVRQGADQLPAHRPGDRVPDGHCRA